MRHVSPGAYRKNEKFELQHHFLDNFYASVREIFTKGSSTDLHENLHLVDTASAKGGESSNLLLPTIFIQLRQISDLLFITCLPTKDGSYDHIGTWTIEFLAFFLSSASTISAWNIVLITALTYGKSSSSHFPYLSLAMHSANRHLSNNNPAIPQNT